MIDIPDPIHKGQTRREKIQAMQIAVTKDLESGVAQGFDLKKFKNRMAASVDS